MNETSYKQDFRNMLRQSISVDLNKTSYTLLHRALDRKDEEAWMRLVCHYERFIYYVLHRLGTAPSDVEDLTQQVLIILLDKLSAYDRSAGRFHSWLSTIIRNTAVSHYRRVTSEKRRLEQMKQAAKPELLSVPAEIDAVIEKEWAVYISTQAIERVRRVSSTQAVQVLEMILDGHQASDIAKTTGLSHPSVYSFKKRLKKQLCIEVLSLTADLEP